MDGEDMGVPDPASSSKQPGPASQSVVAWAWAVVGRVRSATGTPRQVVLGSLLGICVVFLAALLATQHLDRALTVALIAFVVAIPFLGFALVSASEEIEPGPGALLVNTWRVTAWAVDEGLGSLAVLVGFVAVIWHLSGIAVIAFFVALVLAAAVTVLGAAAFAAIPAYLKFK